MVIGGQELAEAGVVDLVPKRRCRRRYPGGGQQRADGQIAPALDGDRVDVAGQPGQRSCWQWFPGHGEGGQERKQAGMPGGIVLPAADLVGVVVAQPGGQITDLAGPP